MFRCALVLCAVSLSSLLHAEAAARPICEIFSDLRRFDNTVVLLIGELTVGREEVALRGVGCPAAFESNGLRWPTAIWLVVGESKRGWPAADPELDRASAEVWDKAATEAKRLQRPVQIILRGRLKMLREPYQLVKGRNGLLGNAFGQFGIFPAEMRVWEVKLVPSN